MYGIVSLAVVGNWQANYQPDAGDSPILFLPRTRQKFIKFQIQVHFIII